MRPRPRAATHTPSDSSNGGWGSKGSAKIDNVPDAFIKAAKKKILAEPPKPKMKDGKPVEVFTYFFYVPGHSNVVAVDLDKPLDKQP
jgi:hypothetical protein